MIILMRDRVFLLFFFLRVFCLSRLSQSFFRGRWDLIRYLTVRSLKLKSKRVKVGFFLRVLVILLSCLFKCLIKSSMALKIVHFFVFFHLLTLVGESSTMDDIPRVLIVPLLLLELILFCRSLPRNLLEVNRERISAWIKSTHAQIDLRDHITLLLYRLYLRSIIPGEHRRRLLCSDNRLKRLLLFSRS